MMIHLFSFQCYFGHKSKCIDKAAKFKGSIKFATDYIPSVEVLNLIANKAKLAEKTKRHALGIMEKVTENEISAGKDPMGLAATVLYISCIKTGENISQKEISNVAGITEVTLRNRFKDLQNHLTDLN